MRPLQPHPVAAGALRRAHTGLPRTDRARAGARCRHRRPAGLTRCADAAMSSVTLLVDTGTGPRPIVLDDYLDAAREEQASLDAYTWIKDVRHARIDGQPLRRQFTVRGDSLWWFTELYLHK